MSSSESDDDADMSPHRDGTWLPATEDTDLPAPDDTYLPPPTTPSVSTRDIEETRRIRREQDAEFEESLRIDQAKVLIDPDNSLGIRSF